MPNRNSRDRRVATEKFWDTPLSVSSCCDGVERLMPSMPQPVSTESPSGLSRIAQLSALHALKVPVVPSYCAEQGGVVVDRVVYNHHASEKTWAKGVLRFKLQGVLTTLFGRRPPGAARPHPLHNVGGCWRLRHSTDLLGCPTTVNATVDVPTVAGLGGVVTRGADGQIGFEGARLPNSRVTLRTKLDGDHELHSGLHLNGQFADWAGVHQVPLTWTLDLSRAEESRALAYRVGLHNVLAPASEQPDDSWGGVRRLRAASHLQGALVFGRTLSTHKPFLRDMRPEAAAEGAPAPDDGKMQVKVLHADGNLEDVGRFSRSVKIVKGAPPAAPLASVAAAGGGGCCCPSDATPADGGTSGHAASGSGGDAADVRSQTPLAEMLWRESSPLHVPAGAAAGASGCDTGGGAAADPEDAKPKTRALLGPYSPADIDAAKAEALKLVQRVQAVVDLVDAPQIQAGIGRARQSVDAAKRLAHAATADVADGTMRRTLRRWNRQASRRSVPWLLTAKPGASLRVRVGAAARTPVNPHAVWSAITSPPPPAPREEAPPLEAAAQRSPLRAQLALLRAIVAPIGPAARAVNLEPFASVSGRVTLGRFRHWVLDHTSVVASLHAGLTHNNTYSARGPAAVGSAAAPKPNPALSIGGGGVYHLLTLSMSQQIVGPVRAFADVRWALQPRPQTTVPGTAAALDAAPLSPGSAGGRLRAACAGVDRHVRALAPERVDTIVGVEYAVLLGRLVAWYSPRRKNGMVELRL